MKYQCSENPVRQTASWSSWSQVTKSRQKVNSLSDLRSFSFLKIFYIHMSISFNLFFVLFLIPDYEHVWWPSHGFCSREGKEIIRPATDFTHEVQLTHRVTNDQSSCLWLYGEPSTVNQFEFCCAVWITRDISCNLYSAFISSHNALWKVVYNRWSLTKQYIPSCIALGALKIKYATCTRHCDVPQFQNNAVRLFTVTVFTHYSIQSFVTSVMQENVQNGTFSKRDEVLGGMLCPTLFGAV